MKRNRYRFDGAIKINQVYAVNLDFYITTSDIVQSHNAIVQAEQTTPFADTERCHTWSVLHRPDLQSKRSFHGSYYRFIYSGKQRFYQRRPSRDILLMTYFFIQTSKTIVLYIVLYLYIYIALLVMHTNQKRFQSSAYLKGNRYVSNSKITYLKNSTSRCIYDEEISTPQWSGC